MTTPLDIREILSESARVEAFGLIRQLRTHLTLHDYLSLVADMSNRGYRMFGLYRGAVLVSVAGVEVMTNLYNLRHLWIYDLVTDSSERSQGYGATLLRYLEDLARRESCASVVLSSGVSRVDAHRFYKVCGFEGVSTVFKKSV